MKIGWQHKEIDIQNNGLLHKGEKAFWVNSPLSLHRGVNIFGLRVGRMSKYNDAEYQSMIEIIFHDSFYADVSFDTKIEKIRKYTEIIIRRLLRYDPDKFLTLGHENTIRQLDNKGFIEPFFRNSLEIINSYGSDRIHTQKRVPADKKEFDEVMESLFNLYGYLFYKYFEKYKFGNNLNIVSQFSLLPPIIRHITLEQLFALDQNNSIVIEKFVLVKIKAFDYENAENWLESNSEYLKSIQPNGFNEQKRKLEERFGQQVADNIILSSGDNMYDILKNEIKPMKGTIIYPQYKDFESALLHYHEKGILPGNSKEIKEFNSLMDFVYMGRVERII